MYESLIAKYLENKNASIVFPQLDISAKEIIEIQSYNALCMIKKVLEDDTISDPECFDRIEQIIDIMESAGCPIYTRHDFG